MCMNVPISEKLTLTLEEARDYSGIGVNKLRKLSDDNEGLVLWVGSKRMIKREALKTFLQKEFSI